MSDENSNSNEEPAEGEDPNRNNPEPNEESGEEGLPKGGADGKTKGPGGKGLGDYPKIDQSERTYE